MPGRLRLHLLRMQGVLCADVFVEGALEMHDAHNFHHRDMHDAHNSGLFSHGSLAVESACVPVTFGVLFGGCFLFSKFVLRWRRALGVGPIC